MASTFVPLKVGGRTTLGAHGIDLMVHPDYRRQGIFKTLGMKLRGLTRAKEWSLTYGTPDDESYQGFVTRLNVLDIGELPFLFKIIDLSAILKNRYRIPVFIGKMLGYAWESITNGRRSPEDTEIKIDEVFSFDEQIDKFWEKASKLKSIMVIKDMKYLNWRYVAKPGKEYKILIAKKQEEIAGFIVLKLVKGAPSRGYIADLLTLPGEGTVAESLIARVIRYFKEEGAVSVSCWLFQNTTYYGILRKMVPASQRSTLLYAYRRPKYTQGVRCRSRQLVLRSGRWRRHITVPHAKPIICFYALAMPKSNFSD